MKICVAVTEVATVEDDFEIDGLDIPERYLSYELNEWDEYAIEEAVQIADANDDVEVVTVTIGPERVEERIRMALAKGADRAIRVWDDALADQRLLDVGTKAAVLGAVIEDEAPDLVLTGVQAGDEANGATGVALAASVDYQWAAVVNKLSLDRDAGVATVNRELEGGLAEITAVDLPAVLTIQTGINDPRYASLRGIRQAQSKPLEHQTLADLGIDSDSLSHSLSLTAMAEPTVDDAATIWTGSAEETAGELATFLREAGVVEQ
jgi:electron transfer flavoprotein beta subunit